VVNQQTSLTPPFLLKHSLSPKDIAKNKKLKVLRCVLQSLMIKGLSKQSHAMVMIKHGKRMVDSTCRDSMDMQYIKISQNLKNGKLISLYDNLPFIFKCFMTYNTPGSTKKHHESTEPESYQTAKYFPSSSSSLDRLVQNFLTLSQWFSHKTAAFYTEQCTCSLLFHNFEV